MRYRMMATYRGAPYEAGIGPADGEVVLFAACPPPEELGFEPATGHWRKELPLQDVQAVWESRPVGMFRGDRCIVLDDLGDRLHIGYLGHDAYRAEQLGYWQVDRGVFELVAARDEVADIVEERTDYPHQGGPTPPPAYLSRPALADTDYQGRTEGRAELPGFAEQATSAFPIQLGAPSGGPGRMVIPDGGVALPPPAAEPPLPLEAEALRAASAASRRDQPSGPASTGPLSTGPLSTGPVSNGLLSNGPVNTGPHPTGPRTGPQAGAPQTGPDALGPRTGPHAVPPQAGPDALGPRTGPHAVPPQAGPDALGPQTGPHSAAGLRAAGLPAAGLPAAVPSTGVLPAVGPQTRAPVTGTRPSAPQPSAPAPALPVSTTAYAPPQPAGAVTGSRGGTSVLHAAPISAPPAVPLAEPFFPAAGGAPAAAGSTGIPPAPTSLPPTNVPADTPGRDTAPDPVSPVSEASIPRRRRAARRRMATERIFGELASLAAIPETSYSVGDEVEGAMCLLETSEGFEVFSCAGGARHEVRVFSDEESACFYLFGVLAADAVRTGGLVPGPSRLPAADDAMRPR